MVLYKQNNYSNKKMDWQIIFVTMLLLNLYIQCQPGYYHDYDHPRISNYEAYNFENSGPKQRLKIKPRINLRDGEGYYDESNTYAPLPDQYEESNKQYGLSTSNKKHLKPKVEDEVNPEVLSKTIIGFGQVFRIPGFYKTNDKSPTFIEIFEEMLEIPGFTMIKETKEADYYTNGTTIIRRAKKSSNKQVNKKARIKTEFIKAK